MNRTLFLSVLATILISCGGSKSSEDSIEAGSLKVTQAIGDKRNARNSLKYFGVYKGTVPAASASGIDVTIKIFNDSSYSREMKYHDKTEVFKDSGKYTWDESGNKIKLEDNLYFVTETRLIMLDINGDRITGELAKSYELEQVEIIE